MNWKATLAALCVSGTAVTAHAQDPHLARNLAASCANCHGTDGRSLGGMESLAGKPQDELLRKLQEFRSGDKPATVMHQIVKGYTEKQLELVTAYFAELK